MLRIPIHVEGMHFLVCLRATNIMHILRVFVLIYVEVNVSIPPVQLAQRNSFLFRY